MQTNLFPCFLDNFCGFPVLHTRMSRSATGWWARAEIPEANGRAAAPTTDERRLPKILNSSGGFLYCVSINAIARVRQSASLPIAVGFGIKTPESATIVGEFTDAAAVGSAIAGCIGLSPDGDGQGMAETIAAPGNLVVSLGPVEAGQKLGHTRPVPHADSTGDVLV